MEDNYQRKKFGLVGRNISYSFSQKYFTEKFAAEALTDHSYENFDLQKIDDFPKLVTDFPALCGLNITIPYKESILPFLDKISTNAQKIGAVNTIRITKERKLKGHNTDWFGFMKSLKPMLEPNHKKALILGTGGASKAVAFALDKLEIPYTFVSREQKQNAIKYELINATTFDNYQIIINCTPVGTFPNIGESPEIPYEYFTENHIAYDLIYNPAETAFLHQAKMRGAKIKNGLEMLQIQADKAWKIWNS